MWFTNHRVKYIEDIVDLWTFLGDADSEIMGSPDSARHTECNSMCLCTWIWWVTLRWSTFSFSSLFFLHSASMLTIFLLYSNFFAFYALFSPILASPHCSFLLFSCCFFYYYFFVSLYVPVSFASFFLSSSFSFSLSCSVCWQTFREDRNKGRHHCVFTSFPPPPPLLPPPHLFFFSFFGLSEVKFPRLFRLLSPLLLQNDTRAKTTASAKAPSNQTNASSEPDDTTKYIKRVDFWMQKKHARACVCVFLTGRMGAPAVCLCDLVKVLLFYFGGTASFSLFLPVTPSLFSSGAARWWWEMRKKWQKLRDVTLSPLAEPLSERVQLA